MRARGLTPRTRGRPRRRWPSASPRHVRARQRVAGARHAHRAGRSRLRRARDDRARRHAERPRDLPRRVHLHARRQRVRVRLQQLQSQHRRVGLRDRLHRAGARGRHADGARRTSGAARAARASTTSRCTTSAARPSRCSAARATGSRARSPARRPTDSARRAAARGASHARPTPPPRELEPIETASRDELAALQLERLQWSLAHAYDNVPHYRRKFDAAGVHPRDCSSLADLAKFPFTTKADLRDNYPFGMFAVPREQVARIHASSGTTGKPTVVGYTQGTSTRGRP